MRNQIGVKRQEYESQIQYIQELQEKLPDDPMTMHELELYVALTRDIEEASRVLHEIEKGYVIKWPWVSCEKYERTVKKIQHDYLKQIERMGETSNRLVCGIRSGLVRLLDKFANIRLSCLESNRTTWRLVFDFDPRPITSSLEKGGDRLMIEQIAEEIKVKIIDELRLLNIQHPADR